MCEMLDENVSMVEEGKIFSNYIKELREKRNVTLENLCDGLCKHQEILYLESGERMLDNRLQNALLERLGVGAENYEQYVDFQEYDRWEARQEILYYISYEQWDTAVELLDKYRSTYGEHNKFEHQFILSMQGQIRKCNGADTEELREIYKKAVRLTMPRVEKIPLCEVVLSLKELNLLLELEQYRDGGERQERYLDIMKYLEKHFDHVGVAKLYPKAVYLLCKCNEKLAPKTLLSYCDKALEYLRETSRMYYMWEMLELRNELLGKRISRIDKGHPQKVVELREIRRENLTWMEALRKVYDEFHVRKDTFEYCYLYVGMGTYCINDVIRIRREMLGISREELCKGFCEVKTLAAIEERKRKPQRATVEELFRRLGLSAEYKKTNIETDKPEVKQLMEKIVRDINSLGWEEAQKKLSQVREKISLQNRFNMQTVLKEEAYLAWKQKQITKEEYCIRMQSALELTVPFEIFLKDGPKYLTHVEQTCIQNLMQGMEMANADLLTCMQQFQEYYKSYEEGKKLQSVFRMYGFVMNLVASRLGNLGKYDEADKLDSIMIEGGLHYHRLLVLPTALYDRLWNDVKREEQELPLRRQIDKIKEIDQIIALGDLDNQKARVQFYRKKREEFLKEKS